MVSCALIQGGTNTGTALHPRSIPQILEQRQPISHESLALLWSDLGLTQQHTKGNYSCVISAMKTQSSDLILTWSKCLHLHLRRVLLKKSIRYQLLQIPWPDFFRREIMCRKSQRTWVYTLMGRGPWLLASRLGWDSLHHDPTPFKFQEGASALLVPGQVVGEERGVIPILYKQGAGAVGGNVTFPVSPSLDQPGLAWLPGKANSYSSCPPESECFHPFLLLFPDKTEWVCFPPVSFGLPEVGGKGSRRVSEHTREHRLID